MASGHSQKFEDINKQQIWQKKGKSLMLFNHWCVPCQTHSMQLQQSPQSQFFQKLCKNQKLLSLLQVVCLYASPQLSLSLLSGYKMLLGTAPVFFMSVNSAVHYFTLYDIHIFYNKALLLIIASSFMATQFEKPAQDLLIHQKLLLHHCIVGQKFSTLLQVLCLYALPQLSLRLSFC